MEIRIRRVGTVDRNGDGSDVASTYAVIDSGKEFLITLRTHARGSSLALVGHEGFLYTDRETNTVRRQALSVGRSCGIIIDADEMVEGLSPWALRGVAIADRNRKAKEIRIIDRAPASASNEPVVFVDGEVVGSPIDKVEF
ncbi:MAG: hypothetical protein H6Q55_1851 [Deltaproteobacteria bacterium]|jgi:hypothetical protein|nr:hypothetical protein [Deltaproteobacteria bacterium]